VKRASIKDVAALADSSSATVSKVLTGMLGSGIPEETAQRVRQAAKKLNYVPLSSAQQLRQQRTQTIAILLAELVPFTSDITHGIQAQAMASGLTTVLGLHGNDNAVEAQHLRMGLRGQVDGLIIAPAHQNRNHHVYEELKNRGVPFVFVDNYLPDYDADYVGLRNEEAAYHLTRTLISQGTTVIGGIFNSGVTLENTGGNTALHERFLGYRRALAEAHLSDDERLCVPLPGEGLDEMFVRLLTSQPVADGVLWASYQFMQPTLSWLAARSIHVPGDLRFAGFDKVLLTLSTAEDYQSLQVIREPWPAAVQPGYEMGERALELLRQAMAGNMPKKRQHILLPPHYEWVPQ
jgi:DNA-binding LacI/PurR family transcriptional regulator